MDNSPKWVLFTVLFIALEICEGKIYQFTFVTLRLRVTILLCRLSKTCFEA